MAIADDNPQQQGLKKGLFHVPLSGICGLLSAGLALGSLHPQVLRANPSGGSVAAGTAGISSHGSTLTITQGSNRAIINWQDFSISAGETTRFIQPSSSSAMLNRVIGGNPSQIHGRLQANGQVYLINPNGILVGPGGVVDTGGFLASTLDLSDDEFLRGGDLRFSGNSNASVINLGSIGASEGDVILIARTVENQGEIRATNGTAVLAAGSEVLVKASGEDRVFIEAGKGSVTNKGLIEGAAAEIKAAGGNEYALAINNEGTVRATGVSNSGGRIRLVANGGKIRQAGTLRATKAPTATENADVRVLGKDVEVTETSRIEAPGGFVETSGDRISIAPGSIVDTRAGDGTAGTWLIDPADLNVVTGGGNDPTASTVDPLTVASLLNSSNITLQATNSITVSNLIDASANAAANSLTLDTVTLNLNAPIILKTGATLSGSALLTTVNVGAGGHVQNGIDAVAANGTVNLAASTYNLPGTVNIAKNVTLNGTAGSTVLDADNAFRVMTISGGDRDLGRPDPATRVGGIWRRSFRRRGCECDDSQQHHHLQQGDQQLRFRIFWRRSAHDDLKHHGRDGPKHDFQQHGKIRRRDRPLWSADHHQQHDLRECRQQQRGRCLHQPGGLPEYHEQHRRQQPLERHWRGSRQ